MTEDRRICVLYADTPATHDGIRDFSDGLARALGEVPGVESAFALWGEPGWEERARGADSVLVQYNPFSYGRRGFAPRLIVDLRRLGHARVSLMVHEPYMPISDWRSAMMSAWQRLQLRLLVTGSEHVAVSAEGFRDYLPTRHRERTRHLPVGSPLPDARTQRAAVRRRLGAGADRLVVALYGSAHPSRLPRHCEAAIQQLAEEHPALLVLNLGADAPALRGLPAGVDVVRPGPLEPSVLAGHLAGSDIALLPFIDGASTRRTTFIAALQQGVATLSTSGRLTDEVLLDAFGPQLVGHDEPDTFAEAASTLAGTPGIRAERGSAGRRFFETYFDWPVIARRQLAAMNAGSTL